MQNGQNVAEIQQRVINLVELYRTKVGKESQIAKEAKAEKDYWIQESIRVMEERGTNYGPGFSVEGPHKEMWVKQLMANEQLLGHFYAEVAGQEANIEILNHFLPEEYDTTIFTAEDEDYLKSHFKEMVNYIIRTPNNDLSSMDIYEGKEKYIVPSEILDLLASLVQIPAGSIVYNPVAGFAQLTRIFNGCHYICGGDNPWAKVYIFANGVDAEMIDNKEIPVFYDTLLLYLPMPGLPLSEDIDNELCKMYQNLRDNGKMILIMPMLMLAQCSPNESRRFWKELVNGREIFKIIQLPEVMFSDHYCIVIAEKNHQFEETTFLDAGFASSVGNTIFDMMRKEYWDSFDLKAFDMMNENDGCDPKTGEKRMVNVCSVSVDANMLLPEYYFLKRPISEDNPLPLSSLCEYLNSNHIGKLKFDLPLDTPWLKIDDLSYTFHGPLNLEEIEKANCQNNPEYSEELKSDFNSSGEFIDDFFHFLVGGTAMGKRIHEYRNSSYFDGENDVVFLYLAEVGAKSAIVSKPKIPYAADIDGFMTNFYAFIPKNGVTVLELLALLRMPIVYNQIKLFSRFGGIACHLDDILVPFDERIMREEILRLECEENEYKEQHRKMVGMKTDYINEVRMRKHDMRPHMKQLNSAKNLMQHYVDNLDTIDDIKQNLNRQLNRFRDALSHLSDLIDHFSDEEKFGHRERFSITDYFDKLMSESIDNNYMIEYYQDSGAIQKYLKPKVKEWLEKVSADRQDEEYMKGEYTFPMHWSYTMIAPLDFDRMVQNILENARRHGFTDSSRSDYKIWIVFSVDEKRDMYVIDFKNNGTPLPNGMNKERYGLKGERAGITGGTGSGGYIVKSIVNHYGGDYDVFFNEDMTTIRIWLPIASI